MLRGPCVTRRFPARLGTAQLRARCRNSARAKTAKPSSFAYLAHYALGLALPSESFAPVLDALKTAKELNSDFAPTFYGLAEKYWRGNKYPEMLLEAEALVKLMPRCWQAYQLRGWAWAGLGRAEAFERDFEEAHKLTRNNPAMLAAQCSGYGELEIHEKAIEKCKEMIAVGSCSEVPVPRVVLGSVKGLPQGDTIEVGDCA